MPAASPLLSRRQVLAGAGFCATLIGLSSQPRAQSAEEGVRVLRASTGTARLRGEAEVPTPIWGYDGQVPGPTLRIRRGEELRVRLVNDLPEATVVHWHGVRVPNAMDGVPHLTQPPIAPGKSFDYHFRVPDAGTFWYHSHLYSSEQLARGLYGPLIVEEPETPQVDHDLVLVFDDWRLAGNGRIDDASFRSFHDAAHAGSIGPHLTVNSVPSLEIAVRTNERLRLRLVNSANARVFGLRIEGHPVRVMAIDGQPAEPFFARDGRVVLGPGNRVDVFIDATLAPGASAPIAVHDGRNEVPLARLVYASGAPARPAPLADAKPLPANPLPERINLKDALKLNVPLDGGMMGMMGGGMGRGMPGMTGGQRFPGAGIDPGARIWALAGFASSGHDGPPLFKVKRGRAVMLAFQNRTAFPHSMHVHGHHFRLLDRLDDGWKPYWLDTMLVDVRDTARIAFVADNPGKWMIHCHMLEHQETGMAAWFEVS
jgi:FtsP/CotA-like multicopper oxidase with cupredoxin domain